MHCLESYSWVPVNFLLSIASIAMSVAARGHAGLGLLGYDESRDEYFAFFVDNLGNARTYEVTIDGSTWMFIGKFERATITFEPERNRMQAHWEHSADGRDWKLLCEYGGSRPQAATDGSPRRSFDSCTRPSATLRAPA
jgi:hypothetical protein